MHRLPMVLAAILLIAPAAQAPDAPTSSSGQRHANLSLVFAASVFVRDFADLIALKKQHLRAPLASVNFGRQGGGVAEFKRDVAFPFGLKRRDVDDDAAARVGAFAQADGEHIARNAKVLHGARQREAVGRDDAAVAMKIDKAFFVEVLRVHHSAVDVGENLELGCAANVITVAAGAIADDFVAIGVLADLAGLKGFNHAVLFGHAADPFVAFDRHGNGTPELGQIVSVTIAINSGELT